MTIPVQLRLADPASLERLLPLFRRYQADFSSLTSADEPKTRAFLADLLSRPEQGFVVLAEIQGVLVGFASGFVTVSGIIAEKMIHLGDLYVDGPYRSQGIGRSLLRSVQSHAAARECAFVRWLSVSSNTEANRWYESFVAPAGDFKLFLLPTCDAR